MRNLEQEDEDSFKRQFGKYIKFGVTADAVCRILVFLNTRPTKLLHGLILEWCRSWTKENWHHLN